MKGVSIFVIVALAVVPLLSGPSFAQEPGDVAPGVLGLIGDVGAQGIVPEGVGETGDAGPGVGDAAPVVLPDGPQAVLPTPGVFAPDEEATIVISPGAAPWVARGFGVHVLKGNVSVLLHGYDNLTGNETVTLELRSINNQTLQILEAGIEVESGYASGTVRFTSGVVAEAVRYVFEMFGIEYEWFMYPGSGPWADPVRCIAEKGTSPSHSSEFDSCGMLHNDDDVQSLRDEINGIVAGAVATLQECVNAVDVEATTAQQGPDACQGLNDPCSRIEGEGGSGPCGTSIPCVDYDVFDRASDSSNDAANVGLCGLDPDVPCQPLSTCTPEDPCEDRLENSVVCSPITTSSSSGCGSRTYGGLGRAYGWGQPGTVKETGDPSYTPTRYWHGLIVQDLFYQSACQASTSGGGTFGGGYSYGGPSRPQVGAHFQMSATGVYRGSECHQGTEWDYDSYCGGNEYYGSHFVTLVPFELHVAYPDTGAIEFISFDSVIRGTEKMSDTDGCGPFKQHFDRIMDMGALREGFSFWAAAGEVALSVAIDGYYGMWCHAEYSQTMDSRHAGFFGYPGKSALAATGSTLAFEAMSTANATRAGAYHNIYLPGYQVTATARAGDARLEDAGTTYMKGYSMHRIAPLDDTGEV